MKNKWLFIAALSGFFCVALGAFSTHALSHILEPKALSWIETGLKYQMFHTIALLAIGIAQVCNKALCTKSINLVADAWAFGTLLFSGSLYALAFGAAKAVAFITPIGGISFLIGWVALVYASARAK